MRATIRVQNRILGAQVVGGKGVDKRIDILAVAIQARMTVFDLEEMELAYAPQFGAAKDPINMAGFVAAGLLRGDHPMTFAEDFLSRLSEEAWVLDVRTESEFAAGHVAGALNIPLEQIRGRLNELPRDRPIVVYCQVGQRGYMAARLLLQQGYDVTNIAGGYRTFVEVKRAASVQAM
jgi:rhodanese-related sulfurtransferase